MSWARYDDNLPMNKKVMKLRSHGVNGVAALGAHLLLNTWSRHNGTGGTIEAHIPALVIGDNGPELAGLLAEVGMLDVVDVGWMIHDFHDYSDPKERFATEFASQSASDKRVALSKKRAEAGRKGAQVRHGKDGKTDDLPLANDKQDVSPVPGPVPEPDPQVTTYIQSGQTDPVCQAIDEYVLSVCLAKKNTSENFRKAVHSGAMTERAPILREAVNRNPNTTLDDLRELLNLPRQDQEVRAEEATKHALKMRDLAEQQETRAGRFFGASVAGDHVRDGRHRASDFASELNNYHSDKSETYRAAALDAYIAAKPEEALATIHPLRQEPA